MDSNPFIYLEFLRRTLLPLPGVSEKLAYGTPAFYVNKKIFTRIQEDGQTLVLSNNNRDELIAARPDVYFVTDHYLNYDYVLVNLATAEPDELVPHLIRAWRNRATQKLISRYEGAQANQEGA